MVLNSRWIDIVIGGMYLRAACQLERAFSSCWNRRSLGCNNVRCQSRMRVSEVLEKQYFRAIVTANGYNNGAQFVQENNERMTTENCVVVSQKVVRLTTKGYLNYSK